MARGQMWDGTQWVSMTNSVLEATDVDAIHDNVAGEINAITEKATPVGGDLLIIEDSAAANVKKKIQISNLPGGTDHGALSGLADNDHPQYSLTSHGHDDFLGVGSVLMYGGASAPTGFLLCDGSAVSRTTYSDLFTAIGTAYGIGDGSSTFNLPDMRQSFPIGKATAGTASTLGDTGGTIDATIDIEHSHTDSHTHDIGHGHTDTFSAASNGAHTHTMGTHTHTTSIDHNHGAATSGSATVGSATADANRSGLFSENDLDTASDNTSHRHGPGTYNVGGSAVTGNSSYATASHYHYPASNAKEHTHSVDLPNYDVASVTSSATDPGDAASSGAHTHSVTGSVTNLTGNSGASSGGIGNSLSATQSIANPPFVTVNFIIKT